MKQETRRERRDAFAREVRRTTSDLSMDSLAGAELLPYLASAHNLTEWAASEALVRRGAESIPTLLEGLAHPEGKIRAACALLLDHVADNRCIEPLLHAIRHDPLESVRRCALHSLVCDGCKTCPLSADVVGALIEVAENDRSLAVRRRAVFYLSAQRPDPRIVPFLQNLIAQSADAVLLRRADNALRRHAAIPAASFAD